MTDKKDPTNRDRLPDENNLHSENKLTNKNRPLEFPIDGTLDLHIFAPSDVKTLIPDYLDQCRKKGISQIRIIHGKGTGAMRETVHAILDRIPEVVSYRLAGEGGGGWGATIVILELSGKTGRNT